MTLIQKINQIDGDLSGRLRLSPAAGKWWRAATVLAHSGDSWFWLAGLGLVWLFTRGDVHNRAALYGVAIVLLAVLVLAIKFIVRRRRPEGEWGAIYRNTDPHSFPSGHAARAVLLGVMAMGLGPSWFGWLMAAWAPLVSLARVSTGVHYLTDVLAGMLLGALVGLLMVEAAPVLIGMIPLIFSQ